MFRMIGHHYDCTVLFKLFIVFFSVFRPSYNENDKMENIQRITQQSLNLFNSF